MALNSGNVRVAVTGAVYQAATSATAPTSPTSTLTGFTDLGYVSEDGITEARERGSEDLKAWQNGDVVRTIVTEGKITFAFTLIETTTDSVELYYGGTVTPDTGYGSIPIVPTATGGRFSFVIDVVDGAELIRTYVPSGEVTEVGEQVYASGEPIGYEITITGYPSGGFSAKKFYSALGS